MTNIVTMSRLVNIADLKARLSEFVEVAEGGEEVLVCRRNLPVARLVPLAPVTAPKRLADVRGWTADDDPFPESLEKKRTEAAELKRGDPFAR